MNLKRYRAEALKVASKVGVAFDGLSIFAYGDYIRVTFHRRSGPFERDEDGYEILSNAPKLHKYSVHFPIDIKIGDFSAQLKQSIEDADIMLTIDML